MFQIQIKSQDSNPKRNIQLFSYAYTYHLFSPTLVTTNFTKLLKQNYQSKISTNLPKTFTKLLKQKRLSKQNF